MGRYVQGSENTKCIVIAFIFQHVNRLIRLNQCHHVNLWVYLVPTKNPMWHDFGSIFKLFTDLTLDFSGH